jgi:hypothetical protein
VANDSCWRLISGALGIGVGTKNFGVRRPVKLGAGIGGGLESSFCIHPCFFMLGGYFKA